MPTGVFDRGPGSKWYEAQQRRRGRGQRRPGESLAQQLGRTPNPERAQGGTFPAAQDLEFAPVARRQDLPAGARYLAPWRLEWTRRPA